MCGITGAYLSSKPQPFHQEQVKSAVQALRHRGPDFSAIKSKGSFICGHSRLSIIDLSPLSNQPMQSEDGRYTLVFNGEIYNYHELKSQLIDSGDQFKSSGDTEVLLHWLIQKGVNGIEKLNGFFAFAYYDHEKDEVLLVRDRMGQKPLYYAEREDGLYFASELTALRPYFNSFTPNTEALSFYLRYSYIPAPHTAVEGVHKLLPGEYLIAGKKGISKKRYYRPANESPTDSKLFDLMEDAVIRRLISDRPIGSFLSGGIDSSIITALAARHHPGIDSFSIGFDSNKYLDESKVAEQIAKELGTRHHRIAFESRSIPELINGVLDSLDEPFADSSSIAYYLLCEFASDKVTVALSGDGADELFGGYRKHRAHAMLQLGWRAKLLHILPEFSGSREGPLSDQFRKLGKLVKASKLSPKERYLFLAAFAPENHALINSKSASPERIEKEILNRFDPSDLNQILLLDQELVLPNDMLHKADRMSMAHSLEVRSPFMDHRVVSYANSLSASHKFTAKKGKLVLRDTFKDLVPNIVWNQPKRGFEVPLRQMLENELKGLIDEQLSPSAIEKLGIFSSEAVKRLKHRFETDKDSSTTYLLWAILVAQHWFGKHG